MADAADFWKHFELAGTKGLGFNSNIVTISNCRVRFLSSEVMSGFVFVYSDV